MEPKQEIEAKLQVYFESLYESDPGKIREAFHPAARITGYLHGELAELTLENLAEAVEKQVPSDYDQGLPKQFEIISIQLAGNTAVALARTRFMGLTFLDTLSLLKVDDDWLIYNKLFHVEP